MRVKGNSDVKPVPVHIAVFGSSGFVGSAVADSLRLDGCEVTRIHSPRIRSPRVSGADAASAALQLADSYSELVDQLRGVEIVVNAAGLGSADSIDEMALFGANAVLPALLLLLSEKAGARRFIHISSAAVQGRRLLDETMITSPFSRYSDSKCCGELALLSIASSVELTIYRPPGVHASGRRTTQQLARYARSRLSAVARNSAGQPTPQALLPNVADAVKFLARRDDSPTIVMHPWEGLTTEGLLNVLGNQPPRRLPSAVAGALVWGLSKAARTAGPARRLEVLWFGQGQSQSWLTSAGWKPPNGISAWRRLSWELTESSSNVSRRPVIVFAVTTSYQVPYLGNTPRAFDASGWDVRVVAGGGAELEAVKQRTHSLSMERDPAPVKDAGSLLRWVWLLARVRPDAVMIGTPKAALLGLLAARITRVRVRVYLLRGLRLETVNGVGAYLLRFLERVAMRCSTHVIAISPSLREKALDLGLVGRTPIEVLGAGSSHGIDLSRFAVDQSKQRARRLASRSRLGLSDKFVVGFVGRVRADKGIPELLRAIASLDPTVNAHLVIVGRTEEDLIVRQLNADPELMSRVTVVGHVNDVEDYYPAFDVLCLPSHREGFGNVVIEAAASGVPSVVSDATGVRDTVIPDETGLIVPRNDDARLAGAIVALAEPGLRGRLGVAARERAISLFGDQSVNDRYLQFVWSALQQAGSGRRV